MLPSPFLLARTPTEMHAQTHQHQGLCKSSLLFITQGPRVPEGDSSPFVSVAAPRRPVLTTTFLLERGEPRTKCWHPAAAHGWYRHRRCAQCSFVWGANTK